MDCNLGGQTALVTGASRGIGAAIAVALAEQGADLALVARDASALAAVKARVEALGGRCLVIAADLSEAAACADAVHRAIAGLGPLDILVNSAGATKRGDFLTLTDTDWDSGYALKFFGTMRMCRAAWPSLASRAGRIITVAGVGSRTPSADFTIGGSVNSALLNLMKALADRGRQDGVRVNVINPGYVATERLTGKLDEAAARRGVTREVVGAELLASIGVRRFAEPHEIGALAAFLASHQANYIDGAVIDIDGGWTRGI
jgi:3-oxoacyl-[acyl-carrier protein] reductase